MPTYQYACTDCGEQLEAVQSFSDPALTECPACQGKLRKVFNSVGIVFKGSGFYRNDSRPGNAGAEKANGGAVETKSDAKSDSKADSGSKPDSKPAATTSKESSSTPPSSSGGSTSSPGGAKAGAASA